jgi:hypothetical protein
MLDYSKYESTKKYPTTLFETKRAIAILEKHNLKGSTAEIERLQKELDALKQQEQDYKQERINLQNQWQQDMYELYGVTDNPKVDKAFSIAWDYGHSSGLREVENYFSEIVELIKD